MKKIINYIKTNKITMTLCICIVILFIYCGLNTFVINDDLAYSLFNRSDVRVTNIFQIIRNQGSDYLNINGRFFVHCIVQFLLIFGKKLFSILNAIVLIFTFIYIIKIANLSKENNKINNNYLLLLIVGLFLLQGKYKYMIYWVAGSVNYIWVYGLILLFLYMYLTGKNKNNKMFLVLAGILSILHECSFAFVLFLLIGDIFIKLCNREKIDKKQIKNYALLFVINILLGLVVIKAPGNFTRISLSKEWYAMSFIKRLCKSIPVVSLNLFRLFDLYNLLPTIMTIFLLIYNYKQKDRILTYFNIMLLFNSSICVLLNNGWFYLLQGIIIFINLFYLYNKLDIKKFIPFMLATYAVVYSMIITPEYAGARPNYYFNMFIITNICLLIRNIKIKANAEKILKLSILTLMIITSVFEIYTYSYIGSIHRNRLHEIERTKNNNLSTLNYKIIKEPFSNFHADSNMPENKDYWAFKYFCYYYELPTDIDIKLIP